ncbi:Uncharacterized protein APZ42_005144, partial [Daphnia magna]
RVAGRRIGGRGRGPETAGADPGEPHGQVPPRGHTAAGMIPVAAGRPAVAVHACIAWLTAWALMGSLCTMAHATPHGETNTRYLLRTAAEQGGAPKWLQHGPQMHSGFCADVIAALNQRGTGLK